MNYQDVVNSLEPLTGHYIRVHAQPGSILIGEAWAEDVRYLRPEERLPHAAERRCTVIIWTGLRDADGMPVGFIWPAALVQSVETYPPDSFKILGDTEFTVDTGEVIKVPVELWITRYTEPKSLPRTMTDHIWTRYRHNTIDYHFYVKRKVREMLEAKHE